VATVKSDESSLGVYANDVSFDLGRLPAVLGSMDQNTTNSANGLQTVSGETDPTQTCTDVQNEMQYFNAVVTGLHVVAAYAADGANRMQSGRAEIAALEKDFATLSADESGLAQPPTGAPSRSDVDQAIATASRTIGDGPSQLNGFIDRANSDVTASYLYAANANQMGNCNNAPATPGTLAHVS
jgi:hypothetical protein